MELSSRGHSLTNSQNAPGQAHFPHLPKLLGLFMQTSELVKETLAYGEYDKARMSFV